MIFIVNTVRVKYGRFRSWPTHLVAIKEYKIKVRCNKIFISSFYENRKVNYLYIMTKFSDVAFYVTRVIFWRKNTILMLINYCTWLVTNVIFRIKFTDLLKILRIHRTHPKLIISTMHFIILLFFQAAWYSFLSWKKNLGQLQLKPNMLTLILPTPKVISLCHQYRAWPTFQFSYWYPLKW